MNKDSELNGRKHSQNLICSEFPPQRNLYLLLPFLSTIFQRSLSCIYDLSCILMTRHEHLHTWFSLCLLLDEPLHYSILEIVVGITVPMNDRRYVYMNAVSSLSKCQSDYVFPSGDAQLGSQMLRCGNIILFIVRFMEFS
jgi:hypothetical protein